MDSREFFDSSKPPKNTFQASTFASNYYKKEVSWKDITILEYWSLETHFTLKHEIPITKRGQEILLLMKGRPNTYDWNGEAYTRY